MCFKKIAGVLRAFTGTPHPKNFTTAIVAAAGLSERFGGETTKQQTLLCGETVLYHTLRAYQDAECIHEIVLVAKRDEIPLWQALCEQKELTKVVKIIPGGHTRQASVLNGLDAVNEKTKYVAIADGARCLTTPEQIEAVCLAARKYKAATAAHRATDTIKIADKNGFIAATTDRNSVWLAQTPQVFKTNLYRAAAYSALKKSYEGTDDNSLVEWVGHPVRLVECGGQNIKITTKDDLTVARAILEERKRQMEEL